MKVLVTYISWTGNTKKVAEAIFQEIQGEKELKEFKEVSSFKDYGLIFVGFPMRGFGKPPVEAEDFLKKCCLGKKIALFITHGAPEDSPFIADWLENCKKACLGAEFLGIFNCQGQMAQEELDKMLNNPDPEWQKRGQNISRAKGFPDTSRLALAHAFAKEIMLKL